MLFIKIGKSGIAENIDRIVETDPQTQWVLLCDNSSLMGSLTKGLVSLSYGITVIFRSFLLPICVYF